MNDRIFEYIICLQNTHAKLTDNASRFMLIMSLSVFGWVLYGYFGQGFFFKSFPHALAMLFLSIVVVAFWIYIDLKIKNPASRHFRAALMVSGWAWLTVPQPVYFNATIATFFFIAAMIEKRVKVSPEVGFDYQGVSLNTFPKKTYLWGEIDNVVIKDNLLTIDLKNNVLIQRQINREVEKEEEESFNNFCRQYLTS